MGLAIATPAWDIATNNLPDLVCVRHAEPATLAERALAELGGMERFVKKGDSVLLKPNIGWDRAPEQGANTNPDLVGAVVRMCFAAGANKVRVLDRTCNEPRRCYRNSGIEAAAKANGAEVRHVVESRFKDMAFPEGVKIKSWPVYKDVFDFDVLINIPVAKDHTVCRYSLGMKNLMGLLGGDRGQLHLDFDTTIVDINTGIVPALTIIDAYRVLVRNGPTGGNPADVELKKTLVVSTDRVAADAYATTLFGAVPFELEYIVNATQRGLGIADLDKLNIREIAL